MFRLEKSLYNTVIKSCPIFLATGVFLVISFIVFLIPTCSHRNNLYYFSAGILFIVSGPVMLIGLIAYISILKEIGSKLRPPSTLQPALIKVSYGQSFFLFVFGFIVTEFVGVLNIFLFINLQEVSYYNHYVDQVLCSNSPACRFLQPEPLELEPPALKDYVACVLWYTAAAFRAPVFRVLAEALEVASKAPMAA
ncbi:voltage-dependent calcium channel gamma-7 subunit-like [Drosophila takahashii]|uniref:voltage-dependent calcium channel gamma-7 subunit-like n=1 Tax=Drosophila takahashii TaxID=29030 RepID=UPI0038996B4B